MSRETLYVAMTRGRQANTAYVITDQPDDEAHLDSGHGQSTGHDVLHGVLKKVGAEMSVHEALRTQHDEATSIAQLAAEYETIAAAAQHERWAALVRSSGLTSDEADEVISSEAFGPFSARLRLAEAAHHDPDKLLPRLVAGSPLGDANDLAAVLHHRLARAISRGSRAGRPRNAPRLIAGLIPEAVGPMSADMRRALHDRGVLIEQRAHALVDAAIGQSAAWLLSIGRSGTPCDLTAERGHLRTIVAYRDRYGVKDASSVLGPEPRSDVQRRDVARAREARQQATRSAHARQARDHAREVRRGQVDRPTRSI